MRCFAGPIVLLGCILRWTPSSCPGGTVFGLRCDFPVGSDLKAISFDVGGTLIEPWPSVQRIYAAVAGEFGCPGICEDRLKRQFAAAWKARRHFGYSREEWRELVAQTYEGTAAAERVDLLFPALYERFEQSGCWRVFPEVVPVLGRLRALGFRLAVTSNWDERLRPLLSALALRDFFEVVTVSVEEGVHKPDARLFHRTCGALELPAGQVLHVGDSVREDFEGAREAGLRAIHVTRDSAGSGVGPPLVEALQAARITGMQALQF